MAAAVPPQVVLGALQRAEPPREELGGADLTGCAREVPPRVVVHARARASGEVAGAVPAARGQRSAVARPRALERREVPGVARAGPGALVALVAGPVAVARVGRPARALHVAAGPGVPGEADAGARDGPPIPARPHAGVAEPACRALLAGAPAPVPGRRASVARAQALLRVAGPVPGAGVRLPAGALLAAGGPHVPRRACARAVPRRPFVADAVSAANAPQRVRRAHDGAVGPSDAGKALARAGATVARALARAHQRVAPGHVHGARALPTAVGRCPGGVAGTQATAEAAVVALAVPRAHNTGIEAGARGTAGGAPVRGAVVLTAHASVGDVAHGAAPRLTAEAAALQTGPVAGADRAGGDGARGEARRAAVLRLAELTRAPGKETLGAAAAALARPHDGVAHAAEAADFSGLQPRACQSAVRACVAAVARAGPGLPAALAAGAVAAADVGLRVRGEGAVVARAPAPAQRPVVVRLAQGARDPRPVPIDRVGGAHAHAGPGGAVVAGPARVTHLPDEAQRAPGAAGRVPEAGGTRALAVAGQPIRARSMATAHAGAGTEAKALARAVRPEVAGRACAAVLTAPSAGRRLARALARPQGPVAAQAVAGARGSVAPGALRGACDAVVPGPAVGAVVPLPKAQRCGAVARALPRPVPPLRAAAVVAARGAGPPRALPSAGRPPVPRLAVVAGLARPVPKRRRGLALAHFALRQARPVARAELAGAGHRAVPIAVRPEPVPDASAAVRQ